MALTVCEFLRLFSKKLYSLINLLLGAVISVAVRHKDVGSEASPLHTSEVIVNGRASTEVNTSFLLTVTNDILLHYSNFFDLHNSVGL